MAYTKQNFADGQVLKAEHLNHIEEGLSKAAVAYEEGGVVEVLAETTVTALEAEGEFLVEKQIELTVGEHYVVRLNGVDYPSTVVDLGDGTSALINDGANLETEENLLFFIMSVDGTVMVQMLDGSTSVTISIYQNGTVIHPIDGKYLPNGTPWIEENGVLLGETNASSFTHPSFGTMWGIYKAVDLKVGETYTVIYNGVDYECVCQAAPSGLISDPNAVAMGNFSVVGGANTGEPFAMLVSYAYEEVDIIDLVGSASVKVGINGVVGHKMDSRCLPDVLFNVNTIMSFNSGTVTSCDKSYADIVAAHNAGKFVRCILTYEEEALAGLSYILHIGIISDIAVGFGTMDGSGGVVKINADGTVTQEKLGATGD